MWLLLLHERVPICINAHPLLLLNFLASTFMSIHQFHARGVYQALKCAVEAVETAWFCLAFSYSQPEGSRNSISVVTRGTEGATKYLLPRTFWQSIVTVL